MRSMRVQAATGTVPRSGSARAEAQGKPTRTHGNRSMAKSVLGATPRALATDTRELFPADVVHAGNVDHARSLSMQAREVAQLAAEAAALAAEAEALEQEEFPTHEDLQRLERAREKERVHQRRNQQSRAASSQAVRVRINADNQQVLQRRNARRQRRSASVGHGMASARRARDVGTTAQNNAAYGSPAANAPTTGNRKKTTAEEEDGLDLVRIYLKDIGQYDLLNSEQEIQLAKEIQNLLMLERVRDDLHIDLERAPTTKEWADATGLPMTVFMDRVERGRRAKNHMISANLRLVVSIAKKYVGRGMSLQDLIQEGSMGLIRGAEKFDHTRGYKFSTYAHWWIRQAVTRSIADQSRTIRLPVHLFEIMSRIKKTTKRLEGSLMRKPTNEEISEAMEIPQEKLEKIFKAALLPVSLEAPIGNSGDPQARTLGDTLEDESVESPDDTALATLLGEDLENVLNTLNAREGDVLRLRYGLDDGKQKTLEEIGNYFNVTRERIRQIEAKALRKLRQPSRNSVLGEYLEFMEEPEEVSDIEESWFSLNCM